MADSYCISRDDTLDISPIIIILLRIKVNCGHQET